MGARPWYHLSLPGTTKFDAFTLLDYKDPLRVWPDEWRPDVDTVPWSKALDWSEVPGFAKSVKSDVGFEDFTVNYTFNYCFDSIPTRLASDESCLIFDMRTGEDGERDFLRKQQFFYSALKFVHQYPTKAQMQDVLGLSQPTFHRYVQPTVYGCSRRVNFADWNLRLWDYNHTEHFVERVLTSFDGFPITFESAKRDFRASRAQTVG